MTLVCPSHGLINPYPFSKSLFLHPVYNRIISLSSHIPIYKYYIFGSDVPLFNSAARNISLRNVSPPVKEEVFPAGQGDALPIRPETATAFMGWEGICGGGPLPTPLSLSLQVVKRCLELGAASARYVSGSMEDTAFPEVVVKEAENTWGRWWGAAPPHAPAHPLLRFGAIPATEKLLWFAMPVANSRYALLPGGLDMLILNHIGYTYFNYFNGDVGHIRKLLETNFLSYVAMTVSALPLLKESEGSIVVVSSMAGEHTRGQALPAHIPSSACKGSLLWLFFKRQNKAESRPAGSQDQHMIYTLDAQFKFSGGFTFYALSC